MCIRDSLWQGAQELSDESGNLDILRAFVAIILDLDGWREQARPGEAPETVFGFCPRGGIYPVSLRRLANVYADRGGQDAFTAQKVNAELRLIPGIIKSNRVSPLHKNFGLTVDSGHVLAELVRRVGLVEEAQAAITAEMAANPLYSEILNMEK